MTLQFLNEFILGGLIILVLTVMAAVVGLWAWAIARLPRGEPLLSSTPILPLQPARWGGRTVAAVVFLYVGANLAAGIGYGALTGDRRAERPVDQPASAADDSRAAEDLSAQPRDEVDDEASLEEPRISSFGLMLINAVACVLVLIGLPVVLRLSADVEIVELGVSTHSWPRQVGVGVAAALLTTPVVYAVQALAVLYWEPNDHEVQKMLTESMSLGMALFAVASTVFLAPLVEESLFRGVLLGWLTRLFSTCPPRGLLNTADATGMGADSRNGDELSSGPPASGVDPAPRLPEAASPSEPSIHSNLVSFPAIIATSLVFAAMHASQWPAPVGIFLLSIVVGLVYQRTGSLLTAVVMHAVFNGCGTLLLLVGLMTRVVQDGSPEAPQVPPGLRPAAGAVAAWVCSFL